VPEHEAPGHAPARRQRSHACRQHARTLDLNETCCCHEDSGKTKRYRPSTGLYEKIGHVPAQ
jgi:hypothetical protein